MGSFQYPQYRMYWSSSTQFPKIAECLQGGLIHQLSSLEQPNRDKLYKLGPVIESIREKFLSLQQEEYQAFGKQVISEAILTQKTTQVILQDVHYIDAGHREWYMILK